MKTRQAAPTTAIAMRRRSDQGRSALTGGLDAIAASLEIGDEARTQLAPQVVDVDLDRVAGDVILESIQLLLDLGAVTRQPALRIRSSTTAYSRAVSPAGSPWQVTTR